MKTDIPACNPLPCVPWVETEVACTSKYLCIYYCSCIVRAEKTFTARDTDEKLWQLRGPLDIIQIDKLLVYQVGRINDEKNIL